MDKKEYLDKIVSFIVDDTVVDQDNKTWYPPFPKAHLHPPHKIFYNLITMAEMLSPIFLMDNIYVQAFRTYCRDTYGISLGDKEIKDLWLKYLYALRPKITGFTINESVDSRRSNYLDLILNILLEDSIIERINKSWYLTSPWIKNDNRNYPNLGFFHTILPYTLNSTSDPFGIYCRDNYGLTDKEIYDMWRIYHDEMWKRYYKLSSGKLNESVDRKNKYLDKVADFLVDDTKLDDKEEELTLSLGSAGFKTIYFSDFLWTTAYFLHDIPSYFSGYCKNTYGLTDEEIRYVWKKYRYIIRDKILSIMKNKYRSNNINESVDRKSEYLDKIVDFMLNDTRYSVYTNRYYVHSKVAADIWFPSDSDNGYTYTKDEIHEWTNDYEWYFDGGDIEYICETYSICDRDTIQEMYNRYIQKLSTIIYDEMLEVERRNDSINESVDRKEKLINKIVKFILDDIKNS
jgi:hypothetical protein